MRGRVKRLQNSVMTNGCSPNICFAIDGSGLITNRFFKAQRRLAQLVAVVVGIDPSAEFAATQYGVENTPISDLTSDTAAFIQALRASELQGTAGPTFLSGGMAYCIRQLSSRPGDANKIVFMGDARDNFGRSPARTAKIWLRQPGNSICAVGVGFRDIDVLLDIVGGDESMIFRARQWLSVVEVLEDLVEAVCGFPAGF